MKFPRINQTLNTMNKSILFAAICLLFLCFEACGNDSEPNDPSTDKKAYTVAVACRQGWGQVYIGSDKGAVTAQVAQGGTVKITAVAAENCSFVRWSYELDGQMMSATTPTFTFHNIKSDVTFTAIFSKQGEEVYFEDDFEQTDPTPDPAKWKLCAQGSSAWCRHMSESYDQAYVKDGRLVLVGEMVDGRYQAGGVQMLSDLGFQYGRVEVSARFTKMAYGSWPAIWMMPSKPIWNGWPQCGEIDIMEHLNMDSNVWNVIHSFWVDELKNHDNPPYCDTPYVNTDNFNTYAIEWDANNITFYVNGTATLVYPNLHLSNNSDVKQWPFDAPFYLILNNALGGPGTWPGAIRDSDLPAVFEIDYVRITRPGIIYSE